MVATRPGAGVAADAPICLSEAETAYVSRGALKLVAALAHFRFPAAGAVALDIGASTGGFTDVLLAAGAPGKRLCLPHSRMMIHQPLGGFQGQATDVDIHAREILKLRSQLNEILARHTGQSVETIARDTERDNFMGPEQALEYGLIDRVLTERGVDSGKQKR